MSHRERLYLMGSLMLASSLPALAQTAASPGEAPQAPPAAAAPAETPLYDPQQLPVVKGQVQLFTLTPRGDIDGFILADGTEVKTPPHLSTEIAFAVRPGDAVTIHGLRAASLPLVQAMSVTADATGRTVVDPGPDRAAPGRRPPPPPPPGPEALRGGPIASFTGSVKLVLHGPRGEVNGALLDDGTILRLPPPEAQRLAALLQPGRQIAVEGVGRTSALGKLVEVTALGATSSQLEPVKPGPRGPKGPPPV